MFRNLYYSIFIAVLLFGGVFLTTPTFAQVVDSCRCEVRFYGTQTPESPNDVNAHCNNFAIAHQTAKNVPIVNRPVTVQELFQISGARDILTLAQDAGCRPFSGRVLPPNFNILNGQAINITKDSCTSVNAFDLVPFPDNQHFYVMGFSNCTNANVRSAPSEKPPEEKEKGSIEDLKKLAPSLNLLSVKSFPALIGLVLRIAMGILGSIALIVLIYAGILWMTAAGNADREKKSMKIMMWGALGVLIILSSYAIVQFIFENAF